MNKYDDTYVSPMSSCVKKKEKKSKKKEKKKKIVEEMDISDFT